MSAGGTPDDESLLQAIETFPIGIGALKRNGALIIAAECGKGPRRHGVLRLDPGKEAAAPSRG